MWCNSQLKSLLLEWTVCNQQEKVGESFLDPSDQHKGSLEVTSSSYSPSKLRRANPLPSYKSSNEMRHNTSERPKPEFSAGTGTRTEIIPVRFRFGNSYRNRNRHFTPYSPPKICSKHHEPHNQIKKRLVLVLYSTKTYYTE